MHMFISTPNTLSPERFEAFIEETGLAALVADYRRRGYTIRVQRSEETFEMTVCHPVRKELLFHSNGLMDFGCPERDNFVALMLHEFGHFSAYERGLDSVNEALAWDLAEEISPVPLPPEWAKIRRMSLRSYAPAVKTGRLSPDEDSRFRSLNQCPSCHGTEWSARRDFTRGPGGSIELLYRCRTCFGELIIVVTPGVGQAVYRAEP